jgi:hypothetical protein
MGMAARVLRHWRAVLQSECSLFDCADPSFNVMALRALEGPQFMAGLFCCLNCTQSHRCSALGTERAHDRIGM